MVCCFEKIVSLGTILPKKSMSCVLWKKSYGSFCQHTFFLHKQKKSPKVDHFLFINFFSQNRKNSEKERKYKKIIVYSISFAVKEKYVEIFILIVSQVKYGKYAKYWKKLVAVLNFCFEDDFQFKKYHKYAKSPLNEGGPRQKILLVHFRNS